MLDAAVALAVVGAAHATFQTTVTALVYPALARVRADDFADAHAAHSRRIVLLVALLYGALVVVGTWCLLAGASRFTVAAVGAHGIALLVTATVAAPTHGRLGDSGPTPALLRRLVRADAVRTLAAWLGLVLSLVPLAVA